MKNLQMVDANMTVKELKAVAKERGIKGYSRLLKAELIQLLNGSVNEDVNEQVDKQVIEDVNEQVIEDVNENAREQEVNTVQPDHLESIYGEIEDINIGGLDYQELLGLVSKDTKNLFIRTRKQKSNKAWNEFASLTLEEIASMPSSLIVPTIVGNYDNEKPLDTIVLYRKNGKNYEFRVYKATSEALEILEDIKSNNVSYRNKYLTRGLTSEVTPSKRVLEIYMELHGLISVLSRQVDAPDYEVEDVEEEEGEGEVLETSSEQLESIVLDVTVEILVVETTGMMSEYSEDVAKLFANTYGGYNMIEGVGGWVSDNGELVKEKHVRVSANTNEQTLLSNLDKLAEAVELASVNQYAVSLNVDGTLHIIDTLRHEGGKYHEELPTDLVTEYLQDNLQK